MRWAACSTTTTARRRSILLHRIQFPHSTPLGPAHLRKALYLPALVAMRANPTLRAFADRLRAAGKRPKVVVVAVMRKLPLLAWAILRSGRPYSPTHRSARPAPAVA